MRDLERRSAGLLAALLAIVIILAVYTIFGAVSLVFMKGENEVCRKENVTILSKVEITAADIKGGEELNFTYESNGVKKDFENNFEFKVEIAKTLVVNLVTFKWGEEDNVIVLHAK